MIFGDLELLNIGICDDDIGISASEFEFSFRISKSSANLKVKKRLTDSLPGRTRIGPMIVSGLLSAFPF